MNETLQCLDGQPNLLIPRMYFTFDDVIKSFQFHMPNVDIESAHRLRSVPKGLRSKSRPATLREGLVSCRTETNMGEIQIEDMGGMTVAQVKITKALPPYDEVDRSIQGYIARAKARNKTRMPFLEGFHGLFQKVIELSELQYKFGVPTKSYDLQLPHSPARFSLSYDYNHFVPVTVVTASFEAMRQRLEGSQKAQQLSAEAVAYVGRFDSEARGHNIDAVAIARYGIVNNGGDYAYGQRGQGIVDLEEDYNPPDCRLQTSDVYIASAHNGGDPEEAMFAMLAVGMINRLTLDEIAPGLVK